MNKDFIIHSGDLQIVFNESYGVTPKSVRLNCSGVWENIIDGNNCSLSIQQCGGKKFHAVPLHEPLICQPDDCTQIVFEKVRFADDDGSLNPHLSAEITYDFYDDGTMFCNFYCIVTSDQFQYQDLKLCIATCMKQFDDVKWAVIHRREQIDGAIIQTQGPQRYLERGLDIHAAETLPVISFNGFRKGAESAYLEFFMEGGATLSNKPHEADTSIRWQNNSPAVEWNFQTVPAVKPQVTMQLRNCWGWIIKNPPRTRHLPPYTMYHYLDNLQRYPAQEELTAMKHAGCDILIIHENWRHDLQNNGTPFDKELFFRTVNYAHELGIRIAVYIRGNEFSATDTACAWFDRYLQKDYDGLYMDYGGPMCHHSAADEYFVHGRTRFRQHYNLFRKLRQRVGRNGLLFSHTGPAFSALSMSMIDGYVSGEGEKGMLIKSRQHHEYFSMAAAAPGTMWTAAFPEYSTSRMVPFLAAAGQYPHNPLGEQFPSSSLAHPREPGINDKAFRPLWKLWKLMKDERDLVICNDYNSRGVFPVDPECGHCMFITQDGRKALYVLSNFAAEKRTFEVTPDWKNCGFDPDGKNCYLLAPDPVSPGMEQLYSASSLRVTIEPDGCAAFYLSPENTDFEDFRKPYYHPVYSGVNFLKQLEEQKSLRTDPPRWEQVLLKVSIPPQTAFGYEDSMLLDLFDNESFVVEIMPDGSIRELGKIMRPDGKPLFSGDESIVFCLNELLAPGRHHLAIKATHLGEPFYSFFRAELSDGKGASYTIVFCNELEPDRAHLHFDVLI